jgi:hypothetical protein
VSQNEANLASVSCLGDPVPGRLNPVLDPEPTRCFVTILAATRRTEAT